VRIVPTPTPTPTATAPVSVNSGRLEITAQELSQTLAAGEAVRIIGQTSVRIDSIPVPSLDSFDEWSEKRDEHASSSASAKYVSRETAGFDDLDDYGRWRDVGDYGPVWYPNDVAADWVPYRFGHWAWVDDDAWGFCPFHDGRWVFIGSAWGWLPGPYVAFPVYAPAFVAFVEGPGFVFSIGAGPVALAAWFPLGPGEPFFPWYHYTPEYLRLVNVTNVRNLTNITNIINVRDISQVHYAYRDIATTAVPANVFSSGQRVASHVVRLRPEQLARAQVVPHPTVNPTHSAALPGRLVSPPPIRGAAVTAARNTAGARGGRPVPGETCGPPPVVARNHPPAEGAGRSPVLTTPAPRTPAP
jgi:hypothetical protein